MLTERFTAQLGDHLISQADWQPYPTVADSTAWQTLPTAVRQAHIRRAEAVLGYDWPALPATLYLQFDRNGNRTNFEKPHFERRHTLTTLVLAECLEDQGRFLDDIVNGIWAICEESSWCLPAHIRRQRAGGGLPDTTEPIVDLFAAETGSLLAWVAYLLGDRLDRVSPLVRPRLEREIVQRILDPCLARDDFDWMGFGERDRPVNNWNPWICSNWLACVLLIEADPNRRLAGVTKILRALDRFIDPYPRDGGCDEGPNYWGRAGASLFDNLELLHSVTNGWVDMYNDPLIREIGRFIYRAHIAGDFYLNFADASAIVYPEPMLIYRFGRRIEDSAMAAFGTWLAQRQGTLTEGVVQAPSQIPPSLGRALPDLFALAELPQAQAAPPLERDVWFSEIQVMVARDEDRSDHGFYLAAKGGHNAESHNHNDIGNFVVYVDGQPTLVDAGVETYTAKTFSAQRYEIWTMQSAYHSLLPTIDGIQQRPGRQFAARQVSYQADEGSARLTLDITAAYPPETGINYWQRAVTLHRRRGIEVVDRYRLNKPAQVIELSLLTPCQVDHQREPDRLYLTASNFAEGRESGAAVVEYDSKLFTATTQWLPITDARMGPVWGGSLTRIRLRAEDPPAESIWTFRIRI